MLSAMLSSFLWSVCSRRVVLVSVRSFKIICSKGCRRPKANNHKGIDKILGIATVNSEISTGDGGIRGGGRDLW
jgi:hypothetical protein